MSLLWSRRSLTTAADLIPGRSSVRRTPTPTASDSLKIGAVWACLRLRSDLISTLPLDVYRKVDGRAIEQAKPAVLLRPGDGMLLHEWLYASQMDLDRYGNSFGEIVARDGSQRPMQIELSDPLEWSVSRRDGVVEYRRRGQVVPTMSVWHERQFVVSGLPIGLSPIAYAAMSTGHNLSAQQFALDWFDSGASPSGTLQNEAKIVSQAEAETMKSRFRIATSSRDVFVHGKDWTYTPAGGAASDAKFLDSMQVTVADVCRYFGVPGDMIDAETSTGSITYANVTQRNLQLLTMNLGPAITRRELTFSDRLLAAPRYVKFNTDALLRMDAKGKLEMLGLGVGSGIYTTDEARGLLDMEPLTPEQIAKEVEIKGKVPPAPGTKTGVPA